MSSFTDNLVVCKITALTWMVDRSFRYRIGGMDSKEIVTVPKGFETDFASVPRILWSIFPPDGTYTQAAVLHDYLYYSGIFNRKKCDGIFLEAMEVLNVPWWKRKLMYRAVRIFGRFGWDDRREEEFDEKDKEVLQVVEDITDEKNP